MHFLKKASIKDLQQQSGQENPFRTKTDITSHYKEFELYLSRTTWKNLHAETETEPRVPGSIQEVLKKDKAVISAIHVPESRFGTSGDQAVSSNYLSLCEAIWDDASYQDLEFCIRLADEINSSQYGPEKGKKNPIILIVHAGCVKGCRPDEDSCKLTENGCEEESRLIDEFAKKLNAIKLKTKVKIAVENITPYYDESAGITGEKAGGNCGWRCGEEQRRMCRFLEQINGKMSSGEKDEKGGGGKKNISFGLCVDICHIFASYLLKNADSGSITDKNQALLDAMDSYFNVLHEMGGDIYLLHVSQYGETGKHGAPFQYERDAILVEKIRQLHRQYAPQAAITLEMMDGDDPEKACRYFDDMVYLFSAIHKMGEFAKLLAAGGNEELKNFFEDLFWIYASDGKDTFELSRRAWRVKAYVVKHSHRELGENVPNPDTPFGFILDENIEDTALLRLKAYIYYTRFCNLGSFLAENYYKSFPFSEKHKTDDFRLAMNYFMFNDEMRQCVYTGVAYKFNIDFLPRKESFYRFNDGIEDEIVNPILVEEGEDAFTQITEKILKQINGSTKDAGGKLSLYSVGKNFGQCLFKYYSPPKSTNDWSLRIYRDVPVNYIECNGREYSVPAFLQVQKELNLTGETVGFAIDISLFRKGRNGLNDFFKKITGQELSQEEQELSREGQELSKTKVGSISDGEIVLTQLPNRAMEFKISLAKSMLLKKAYFDAKNYFKEKKEDGSKRVGYQVKFSIDRNGAESASLRPREMDIIWKMAEIAESNQVVAIINSLPTDISKEGKSEAALSELKPYDRSSSNELYRTVEKYIKIEKGGSFGCQII